MFCPKLCRAACPVSNVEANETVTPWGKMSVAYFAARGDVPFDAGHAETAWACTGCFACRERCDHKNEVAPALGVARAEAFTRGVAPEAATKVAARWPERARELSGAMDVIATQTDTDRSGAGEVAVLVGCGYARRAPEVARDAIHATQTLAGVKVRPVRACCGLSLLYAGDHEGFVAAARAFAGEVAKAPRLVAVDPGCARTLLVEYARVGVRLPGVELFVDLAAGARSKLRGLSDEEMADMGGEERAGRPSRGGGERDGDTPKISGNEGDPESGAGRRVTVRWHDPCQLGRGLGRYEEPRAVLEKVAPRVAGFQRDRGMGECSGGGGLLPVTRPETSAAIAKERLAEHERAGGGVLVTHCASSLHRFRTAGEPAVDLASLVARALRPRNTP